MKLKPLILLILAYLFCQKGLTQDIKGLAKQKPFEIRGSLSVGTWYYHANGIENRRTPFGWVLSGSPTVKVYGITFPFTVTISDQSRSFSQPFNRYGVSPHYKWIKLHAGYRNINLSNYTLAGANMLGGGVEINPGKLRAAFMYGRLQRAIREDSVVFNGRMNYLRPTFERRGYGGKIGVGTQNNYFDITFFRGWDVLNSIAPPSLASRVLPKENLAIGIKNRYSFLKNKLQFEVEAAASVINNNLYDTASVNLNGFITSTERFLKPNSHTLWSTAGHAWGRYGFRHGGVRLEYKRTAPNYESLGAYYFMTDIEQITINPNVNLFKSKLSLSGAIGKMRDNLSGVKQSTNNRTSISANANIRAVKNLTIMLNYNNFGMAVSRGFKDEFNDTLAVSMVNSSYGGTVSYNSMSKTTSKSLSLMTMYQSTSDQSKFTRQFSQNSSLISNLNFNYSWVESKLNTNASINYLSNKGATASQNNFGVTVGANKQMDKLRLGLTVSGQWLSSSLDTKSSSIINTANLGYRIGKNSISMNSSYFINNFTGESSELAQNRSFREFRTSLNYGISF